MTGGQWFLIIFLATLVSVITLSGLVADHFDNTDN
jgi:hypothetical protein